MGPNGAWLRKGDVVASEAQVPRGMASEYGCPPGGMVYFRLDAGWARPNGRLKRVWWWTAIEILGSVCTETRVCWGESLDARYIPELDAWIDNEDLLAEIHNREELLSLRSRARTTPLHAFAYKTDYRTATVPYHTAIIRVLSKHQTHPATTPALRHAAGTSTTAVVRHISTMGAKYTIDELRDTNM